MRHAAETMRPARARAPADGRRLWLRRSSVVPDGANTAIVSPSIGKPMSPVVACSMARLSRLAPVSNDVDSAICVDNNTRLTRMRPDGVAAEARALREADPRRAQGRQQAERDRHQERHRRAVREHCGVRRPDVPGRHFRKLHQRIEDCVHDSEGADTGDDREQQRFGHELARDAPASGAQCQSRANLPASWRSCVPVAGARCWRPSAVTRSR